MNSIKDLINAARRSNSEYARLTVGDYLFEARIDVGRCSVFVNGKRKSRKYAESFLKNIRPTWC